MGRGLAQLSFRLWRRSGLRHTKQYSCVPFSKFS